MMEALFDFEHLLFLSLSLISDRQTFLRCFEIQVGEWVFIGVPNILLCEGGCLCHSWGSVDSVSYQFSENIWVERLTVVLSYVGLM